MDFVQILILSIIQGVTEFLPISSQSHLILTSKLLGMSDQGLSFDIALHAGSLIAILIYYRKEVTKIMSISDEGIQYLKLIIIGSIPLPIIGLLFVDIVSENLRTINTIAFMTIVFALLLYFAERRNHENENSFATLSFFTIIFIGFMQTLAIMPGVSRSGIVITAALLLSYSREDSIKICLLYTSPSPRDS